MTRGERAEQPSIPESVGLGPEHAWLGIAVVSLAVALASLFIHYSTGVALPIGTMPVIAAAGTAGVVNWRIGSAERRVRREQQGTITLRATVADLCDQVDSLTKKVEELADQRYQDGHADGFVDGAAATEPPRRVVQPIHTRRVRPRLTSDS
ncbi:hypothetical protein [Micromonospora fulviviridis]|uniref:hypothetical protein n=1 Tax=Micromonospora fulviviridis TaxID=47860 RepID=UPI00378BF892